MQQKTHTRSVLALLVATALVTGCWMFEDDKPELQLWVVDGPQLSQGASYDFADTEVGATTLVTFNVKNDGDAPLHVNGITVGSGFAVLGGTTFEVGDNGGQRSFDVEFTPATAGDVSADLTINSDLPGSPVYAVHLTATGTAPAGGGSYDITYEVTGTGPFTSAISYTQADGTTLNPAITPPLPWTLTFTVDGTTMAYVLAAGGSPTGAATVTASVYKDGVLAQTGSASSVDLGAGVWMFSPAVVTVYAEVP